MDRTLNSSVTAIYFPYGVTISKAARQLYNVEETQAPDAHAHEIEFAHRLAARLNAQRDFSQAATRPARGGELLAMMLLYEIYRYALDSYCRDINPAAISGGLDYVSNISQREVVDHTLPAFVSLYPPNALIQKAISPEAFLSETSLEIPNTEIATRELILLQLSHENRGLTAYKPLFDNTPLRASAPYDTFIDGLDSWFLTQPPFPDTGQTLLEMLRAPLRSCPDSLEGQIEFIMRRWRTLLPPALYQRLLIVQGTLREETMMRGPGPGPVQTPVYDTHDYAEIEAFSRDEDWMPQVVLIAKLAYVWLDQLSKKYNRPLSRLDEIPNEELDQLAGWGFNALWLIGVWERSSSSREIKQRMGNPEAASSAYSLYDYTIAYDLGGDAAFQNLAHRAGLRGIRLAGDMVPNHMGIYSKWMVEHPERFLQVPTAPFPNYHYTGHNLSPDERIGLYIEDGYWNHSDAAVVFKRVDHGTGDATYIYHGNDGTSMPWNDTAQLDFTRQDTREAVIQTIIHVARMFPIIRFDAAMTLAKRHYQRLWFPKPGDGGAIPTRAEKGMSKADFDALFPEEFWREVVDRVAIEAPETLLLAEAFWLMEGYFVRTLGMHRVYNSAFMNMLKLEENSKYRQTIKNVLEFTPEVLQRFVNFMNNPDEDTAEAQFGKGDKYFGVAAMLVTMPGLPMVGHGQIEGFSEKYGMEYRRAYHDEIPDQDLIDRHAREIFPLMRKRYLFSDAVNFALFDFITPDGWVDENVFAYSNRKGAERALIVYNNAYNTTRGVLHTSTAINEGRGDEKRLCRRSLVNALTLNLDPRYYSVFRDERGQLEFLYHNATLAEKGLHLELHAYVYRAFISIREVRDDDTSWGRLYEQLNGSGVPSIAEAYLEMHLADILAPFRNLMTGALFEHILGPKTTDHPLGPWRDKLSAFMTAIVNRTGGAIAVTDTVLAAIEADLHALQLFKKTSTLTTAPEMVQQYLVAPIPAETDPSKDIFRFWRIPVVFSLLHRLGCLATPSTAPSPASSDSDATQPTKKETPPRKDNGPDAVSVPTDAPPEVTQPHHGNRLVQCEHISGVWMREWLLTKPVSRAFAALDSDQWAAEQDARIASLCIAHRAHIQALNTDIWGPLLYAIFDNPDMRTALLVHPYAGRRWMNKEQLERVLYVLFLTIVLQCLEETPENSATIISSYETIQMILEAAEDCGYDFDRTQDVLK